MGHGSMMGSNPMMAMAMMGGLGGGSDAAGNPNGILGNLGMPGLLSGGGGLSLGAAMGDPQMLMMAQMMGVGQNDPQSETQKVAAHHGLDPDDLNSDDVVDHLQETQNRIDNYLAKQWLLGKRKLTVSVNYGNIPLEYQFLQQYHGMPNPLAGTPLGPRFGMPGPAQGTYPSRFNTLQQQVPGPPHGHGPPFGHQHGPPPHQHGLPFGHQHGPPQGHQHGPPFGHQHGPPQGPPQFQQGPYGPHSHTPPQSPFGPPSPFGQPPHTHGPPPHTHGPPPHTHGQPPHSHGPPPHTHHGPPSPPHTHHG